MKELERDLTRFVAQVYEGDTKVLVFGAGDVHSDIVLIGEAPGERETIEGRPFVGKAGKNLDEFLRLTGFVREELYITNVVKFRPTKISAAGRTVNRAPTTEEVELFLPFLKRELALVRPQCVVTMGNTALKALLGRREVISQSHGRFQKAGEYVIYPIYHPASLIYNRALTDVYREDLARLNDWRTRRNEKFL